MKPKLDWERIWNKYNEWLVLESGNITIVNNCRIKIKKLVEQEIKRIYGNSK